MKIKILLIGIVIALLVWPVSAQDKVEKKPLAFEDYAKWRSIRSAALSDNGQWICYAYSKREADDTLYVKNLLTDSLYTIPFGSNAEFADDSKWIAYTINTPYKKAKKLQKDKKPVPKKAELLNLDDCKKYLIENASSSVFSKGSQYFAVQKTKADPKATHRGSDLILHNLETGLSQLIGNVAQFSFNKPGTKLAYTIDAADTSGNSVSLVDLNKQITHILDADKAIYEHLTWDEEGNVLAVLKGTKKKKMQHRDNILLAFTDLEKKNYTRHEFNPEDVYEFPKNMVVSEKGALSWSLDNN